MPGRAIREIMTTNPVVLMADTSIREAARAIREKDIGNVIVQKHGHLCGIVTDRDIVVRAVADGQDPASTTLEFICSEEINALSPDDSDQQPIRLLMQKSVRRLPVVDGQEVVGIVSLGDLAIETDPNSVLGRIRTAKANA